MKKEKLSKGEEKFRAMKRAMMKKSNMMNGMSGMGQGHWPVKVNRVNKNQDA